jgi:hypothetical protein
MHSTKRAIMVAVMGIPMMFGTSAMALADDGQSQVQNQDEIQSNDQSATNSSPVTVNGDNNHIVSTTNQELSNDQNQVGDWDGNTQTQTGGS